MKIDIITYDMIPQATTWGGCQRMYFLAEQLIEKGHEVTVFSVMKDYNFNYGNEIHFNNVQLELNNKIFKRFIYSKGKKESNTSPETRDDFLIKVRSLIKSNKLLFSAIDSLDKYIFNEPGTFAGVISRDWCKTWTNEIIKHVLENDIRCLIISGPPFGMFSIAGRIKSRCKKLKIVYDYRDPWNMWKKRSYFALNREKKYLRYADCIVTTNENLANDMGARFRIPPEKFRVIANGYSEKIWKDINVEYKRNSSMVITYAGLMEITPSTNLGYRDFTQFYSALERALSENMNISLRFVGVTNPESDYAKQLIRRFNGKIELIGVVSNKEANHYMVRSDVLIIIHTASDNSSKYLVNGKYYDYLRAGRYILGIGSCGSIHQKLIGDEKTGMYCDNNSVDIYNCLTKLYKMWENNELIIKIPSVYKYSREYQNLQYEGLLKEVCDASIR